MSILRGRRLALVIVGALALSVVSAVAVASSRPRTPGRVTCSVSRTVPLQYTSVTVTGKVRDARGRAIRGARVVFTWKFKSGVTTARATANSSGIARSTRNIGGAPAGFRVVVTAKATSGGKSSSRSVSFTPTATPPGGNIVNADLRRLVYAGGARLVDVRSVGEFASGHIRGAVNIPYEQIVTRTSGWPKAGPFVVYCAGGGRSTTAKAALVANGFTHVYNLAKGVNAWDGDLVK